MPYIKDAPPTVVRLSFQPRDMSRIDFKADSIGLSRTAYIRRMALEGKVKGYNLKPIREHTVAVGEVAAAVRDMLALPHPDRWAYEADIERIESLLQDLIGTEKKLLATMTRRLTR